MEPRWAAWPESKADTTRWAVGLAVALVLIWASWTLQRLREQERRRATEAEATSAVASELHALAAALASAAEPSDVAGALLARVPALLGSVGGSLGLVEGDDLVIVAPTRGARPILRPGLRLPLSTSAPITAAARTGEAAYAVTRAGFEQAFPDGARLARYAASALAVPLRVEGQVTGAIGFPFNRPHAVDENVLSLAQIAAELGGQALQRSLAYERERSARDALERITRLVPRFVDAPEGAVVAAICEEAREVFDADVAQLWKAGDGRLKVIWRDPPDDRAPPGHVVEPRDYPGMQRSLERLDTTFFRDARTTVTGEALERVLEEGVRSVLRVPIVVAGRAELLLALRWARVVPDPTPELLALVRRFADHAGLVIEQGERRRAEATEQIARARAERLAGDLAQLHAVATSLGAASTASEVAALVAERVQAISAAETTVVFSVTSEGDLAPLASFASDAVRARSADGAEPVPALRRRGACRARLARGGGRRRRGRPAPRRGRPHRAARRPVCARADSRRGNAASRRDHRRARRAAARARAPARARARGAGAGRALRAPDPSPSGPDGRLRRSADARGGGRDAPRRDVRGRRRRRRGAGRDRRRGARAERRALARLPRGAARAGRPRPTDGRRPRRDGGPAPGGVLLREHRSAPRRAPRAARLARGGRFALVRVPPRECRRGAARRRRVRVVAAGPAGRRRARVPRGGRLAVRPRARPGTPLRERARRRRDAPAERPSGDRSFDGGRARRRALPARVERGRRRWGLVRHADALGRAARVRRRRRRRKGRAGGRDDGAAPERDAGDHPRPADARGDRDEAQPSPRALHRRAFRHARVPRRSTPTRLP